MKKRFLGLVAIAITVFFSVTQASEGNVPLADDAPAGLEQFGRLVGNWYIEQQVLQQDGSWQAVDDAHWNFRYALGGYAIQDDWVQPPPDVELGEGERRQFGTNIRIYDSEENKWRIVWASSDQAMFTTYLASATENGELIMLGDDPTRPGTTQRITYYNISETGWSWKLEFSSNNKDWLEVARIQASLHDNN